jgi:hypothetical protein
MTLVRQATLTGKLSSKTTEPKNEKNPASLRMGGGVFLLSYSPFSHSISTIRIRNSIQASILLCLRKSLSNRRKVLHVGIAAYKGVYFDGISLTLRLMVKFGIGWGLAC